MSPFDGRSIAYDRWGPDVRWAADEGRPPLRATKRLWVLAAYHLQSFDPSRRAWALPPPLRCAVVPRAREPAFTALVGRKRS